MRDMFKAVDAVLRTHPEVGEYNQKIRNDRFPIVIAGLDPAIHPLRNSLFTDGCPGQARA